MAVERRFLTGFRKPDDDHPGLIQEDDQSVWVILPDGTRAEITGGGDVTQAELDAEAAARTAHEADTTGVHGIADTSALALTSAIIPRTVMDAPGDLIVGTGSDTYTRLPIGANGKLLGVAAGVLAYVDNSGTPGADGADGATGAPGPAGTGDASVVEAQLDANSAIGATTLTIDRNAPVGWTAGALVAVGAGTAACEIRRITSSSTVTLTLSTALKNAHATSDIVRLVEGQAVPLEWFGAVHGNSAVDSYRALINAFIDQATMTGVYTLIGRGTGIYYSSRPLFRGDGSPDDCLQLKAFSPFGFDCTTSEWQGIPNQYFMTLAGQFGTCTFDAATNQVTMVTGGSAGGQYSDVVFYPRNGSTMPGGIEEGRRYFTIAASGTVTTLSMQQNDTTPVDITSNGSGELVWISTGLARLASNRMRLDGSNTKGLNGLIANVQQPSISDSLRIENFPVIGASIGAQQGAFPNIFIINCWIGLELAGGQFTYYPMGNIEQCDYNVVFAECTGFATGRNFGLGGNQSIQIGPGFHFETAGSGPSQIQTLTHVAGNLTAGAFTLRFKNVLTGSIDWDATAAEIQTILEAHAAIGAGNVAVTQLSGTNLSDGPVQIDFTVGALQWEYWSGSTSTSTGGEMAIVGSTITGGPLSISYINPDAACIVYRHGVNNVISGANVTSGNAVPGYRTGAFLRTEGSAIHATQGIFHGFQIHDTRVVVPSGTTETVLIDDPLNDIYITANDYSFFPESGISEQIVDFIRPARHGGLVGSPIWWLGDYGRQLRWNLRTRPTLEMKAGTTQDDDLFCVEKNDETRQAGFNRDGLPFIAGTTVPDDADLANGELVFYIDTTAGTPTLRYKMKDSAGTVFTRTVTAT